MAKRYIEVSELPNFEVTTTDGEKFVLLPFEKLDDIPAADVVEVVRCKDCRYFTEGMAVGMCKRIEDKPIIPVTYNHFCSYGERKQYERTFL